MIGAVNQSQFTSKMKANAVSRLLSSLVWIDQYNECNQLTALIIFGKIHFLLNQKMSFSWNKTWRNYKFAWNSCSLYNSSSHNLIIQSPIAQLEHQYQKIMQEFCWHCKNSFWNSVWDKSTILFFGVYESHTDNLT